MSKTFKIKKGYDVKLVGNSELKFDNKKIPSKFALKPLDFDGVRPKLILREDAQVKAGTAIFCNKDNEKVVFTSPVSGKITEIIRGEKRVIQEIVIEADTKNEYEEFKKANPSTLERKEIIDNLLKSGVWPFIRQRPFDIIANPDDKPKAIFISTFDSAPLAPDNNFIVEGKKEYFQTGIDALKKLTDGKVHLGLRKDDNNSKVFTEANNVQLNYFSGPHPAGNVGIQIHNIDPINKNEIVWVCKPQDVLMIGRLFKEGHYNAERIFNLTGSEVKERKYHKSLMGANINNYVNGNVLENENRYISGNVLSGTKIEKTGYLGFYDSQITVIPEGYYYEFFGWITPGLKKFSLSRSFMSTWLLKNKKRILDTNLHGGQRAYVMSGEYEKVFPMDIYPLHLIKAIMIEDIDLMENLGIYEVAPEDFALCEVICTSKTEVQKVVRDGISNMIKELG
ncbi:MAG: Na(+)-translocating NADH-quinone reductase subunit A [Bacteroidota bacterium]|nr:Na(+)-translocating NADH-quinone reductase subunit A [Bacteroidota bacterium]